MTDLVERGAIALYTHQAWQLGGYGAWDMLGPDVKAAYRAWARDVFKSAIKPTEAMFDAVNPGPSMPDEIWVRMLKAGLAESAALHPERKNGHAQRKPQHLS